ncbi:MAG: hypothetical protein HXY20_00900 [Acidobacteria bacterium]|nr:hypothetical protein [Acidobacteriota bacterium]
MVVSEVDSRPVVRQGIGYYCQIGSDGRHIGGMLVTNSIGVPLEFKYTEPVTVSRLQKILYGMVLDRYLQETLLRECLARELSCDPEYFITDFEGKEYLGTLAGREMIAIQEVKSKPAGSPASRTRTRESIVEIEDGPMLRVAFSTSDEAVRQAVIGWLKGIAKTMDVLEPIERVKTALRTILADGRRR